MDVEETISHYVASQGSSEAEMIRSVMDPDLMSTQARQKLTELGVAPSLV